MKKDKVVIFGAGKKGKTATSVFKYDKEIIGIIDNDKLKWGTQIDGFTVYSLEQLKPYLNEEIKIIIAVVSYVDIVIQLEKNEIYNYVYFEDVYASDYVCKSREIMDANIIDGTIGQYRGKYVKNCWMNHILSYYNEDFYSDLPVNGKILDVGSGCGTQLFHFLCRGYDAYGIECCEWKLDFCRQKIQDFNFPDEWAYHIVNGKGENLPFEDGIFDAVTCYMVLEHVADWRKCIEEMLRVTKDGGTIRITAPDYRNPYEEHYGIYFGKPLIDHRSEFEKFLEEKNEDLSIFYELNFISKFDVLSELSRYSEYNLNIEDLEAKNPESCVIRMDGRLSYRHRCDLYIKKSNS